jgi:hypothetical protein
MLMCIITHYVSSRARHRAGHPPTPNPALRALIGAALLGEGKYGISTVTAAALCTGVSRSMLYAALILLQSEDESLIVEVLKGHKGVQSAAAKVHGRAKLIEGFKNATVEDRAAFGHAVGVDALFDSAVVPSF